MGLDTSHDCWHGAYGTFSAWRTYVAVAAGYPTEEDEYRGVSYSLPWELFPEERYCGEGWEKQPVEDPLIYLLVHSDCDGVIHPEEGRHIAHRLEQLLPTLEASEPRYEWLKTEGPRLARQFIAGLRKAADAGEDVDFH